MNSATDLTEMWVPYTVDLPVFFLREKENQWIKRNSYFITVLKLYLQLCVEL